jgi:hypothetical protein
MLHREAARVVVIADLRAEDVAPDAPGLDPALALDRFVGGLYILEMTA